MPEDIRNYHYLYRYNHFLHHILDNIYCHFVQYNIYNQGMIQDIHLFSHQYI